MTRHVTRDKARDKDKQPEPLTDECGVHDDDAVIIFKVILNCE